MNVYLILYLITLTHIAQPSCKHFQLVQLALYISDIPRWLSSSLLAVTTWSREFLEWANLFIKGHVLIKGGNILQYIPRNVHTVFALLCFVVVIHWLIFPYPSGLLHWHCGNLTIAPVPAKQPWWVWITTSYEFIMNDCITTTKQSTTRPCAYFLGYTVVGRVRQWLFN